MRMRGMSSVALFLLCGGVATVAQESTRQIEGPGRFDKYLTPGQMDRWIIDGEKDETVIAHVVTREFDPILELATAGSTDDKVFIAVDDKGSESRFSIRLPETGEYSIRVHSFKYQGGGNYSLQLQRFQASPATIGEAVVGTVGDEGKAYHWFEAKQDQVVTMGMTGASVPSWELLDGKGRRVDDWAGATAIEEDGIHSLIISGSPGSRYELTIREARQRELNVEAGFAGSLNQGEMDIWSFSGNPGEFRLVTVGQQGQLHARFIYAPREKKEVERIAGRFEVPEIRFVPVASKGRYLRFAAVLGRQGRYQLQLAPESVASYQLEMRDPTLPLTAGQDVTGTLPVGSSAFYRFRAVPGQLLSASLKSDDFDPTLSLYNDEGGVVAKNDDGDADLGSLITHMIVEEGSYLLQVASLGDGGGGGYELGFREQQLNELNVDGRATGTIEPNNTEFWAFMGTEDQTVLVSVRSSVCNPTVSLYSPEGVRLASDEDSGVGTDSLLAAKLPKTGRYTIRVRSERGAGEYTLRLIDGD